MPTALVTGATAGIGLQTARELRARGFHVLLHGRDPARLTAAAALVEGAQTYQADLASLAEVRRLAAAVLQDHPRLDVLVNNAGVYLRQPTRSADGFEATVAINHLAPFLLTHLLLPALADGRVVNVSSIAHSRGQLDRARLVEVSAFEPYRAYAASKLHNILFTVELDRRLRGRPPLVNALHPGVVSTRLLVEGMGARGPDSLEAGAATSVFLASTPELRARGAYFVRSAVARPAPQATDGADAAWLYDTSCRLTGIEGLPA